tara:strand:+ start:273 stop:1436 length:1164 start_codon:yes stop_codon:yes gene_type:complete
MSFLLHGKYNYIFFVYHINSKKYRYSTNIKINRIDWDTKTQRPKKKKAFNKITDTLNEYQRAYNMLKEEYGQILTNKIVRREFDKYFKNIKPTSVETVSDCFERFMQEKKITDILNRQSLVKYKNILDKVLLYKKDLTSFEEFNSDFFIGFIAYLRNTHKLSDNTLHRQLGILKTFLNWAVKRGYTDNLEYKEHNIKERETSHVALTEDELKIIEELELPEKLSYYRDIFLIGIYSGQRFSDYSQFSKAHLKGDHLEIRQKKTTHICYVPLHPKLKTLLEKYDYKYGKISSQKFNKNIQKICKIAGIDDLIIKDKFYGSNKVSETTPKWKRVGSHTCRRTFITLSHQRGMTHNDIMRVTGIKEPKTLQNYIKNDDENLKNSVNKIWG